MDRTTLATKAQFGQRFASLSSDLQDIIDARAVQTCKTLQLSNLDAEIDTLPAPFVEVHALWLEARTQVLRMNTLELHADKTVAVSHKGEPVTICVDTGQTLTKRQCKDIRSLRIIFKIVARGCDYDERQPVKLSPAHKEVFETIHKIFPRLEALTIRVQNSDEREKEVKYHRSGVSIYPHQWAEAADRERRLHMMQVVRACIDLEVPAWRMFSSAPKKTLVFCQTPETRSSAACKQVELRRDNEGGIEVKGLAGNAACDMGQKTKLGGKWMDWMW